METNYNITFLITMDFAFQMLQDGILTVNEYKKFFNEMSMKYNCEDVRILYQSKLDIYINQSVNGDTKGEMKSANN